MDLHSNLKVNFHDSLSLRLHPVPVIQISISRCRFVALLYERVNINFLYAKDITVFLSSELHSRMKHMGQYRCICSENAFRYNKKLHWNQILFSVQTYLKSSRQCTIHRFKAKPDSYVCTPPPPLLSEPLARKYNTNHKPNAPQFCRFACGCEVCLFGKLESTWDKKLHLLPFSRLTSHSGVSHHPAEALKVAHCVYITPLTCWTCLVNVLTWLVLISATKRCWQTFYPPTPPLRFQWNTNSFRGFTCKKPAPQP